MSLTTEALIDTLCDKLHDMAIPGSVMKEAVAVRTPTGVVMDLVRIDYNTDTGQLDFIVEQRA